jgi:hypothetical protein
LRGSRGDKTRAPSLLLWPPRMHSDRLSLFNQSNSSETQVIASNTTGIGLKSLSRPPLTGVERFVGATVLGASGGFSAYGIGELRGNGDTSLRSTLLSEFAPSAIGATAGVLLNRSREGGSHWLAGYYWGTLHPLDWKCDCRYYRCDSERERGSNRRFFGRYASSGSIPVMTGS